MIFVDRSEYPAPTELLEFRRKSLKSLGEFFSIDVTQRSQRWPNFAFPASVARVVRNALIELFKGRCAYCGELAAKIDHFRPPVKAGRADRAVDLDHYWWLASEWDNLYLCCFQCNARKASLFPIEGPAAAPHTSGSELLNERPLLLDPCHDRPEAHLQYISDGTVIALSHRGVATIALLGMNEIYRVESRVLAARRSGLQFGAPRRSGADTLEGLNEFVSASPLGSQSGAHAATNRAAMQAVVDEHSGDSTVPTTSVVISAAPGMGTPEMVWLQEVEVRNFRTITSATIRFPREHTDAEGSGQPWIMLLGENGVGKSSLLQAVALACMPDSEREELGPAHQWLNSKTSVRDGSIRLTFTDGSQRMLSFTTGQPKFHVVGDCPSSPSLAYGSTRLLPRSTSAVPSLPSVSNVLNLFDQAYPLVNAEPYFCDRRKTANDRFELFANSLEKLLPDDDFGKIARSGGRITRHGTPLEELSGGYKSILGLAMDILFHLSGSSFDMDNAHGLILLDEIELHLHPRWKIRVVEQLRSVFPNARFIVSSHDPLCVQGLRDGELNVFAKHPADESFFHEQIDVPRGTRADEVLTGPWFGMHSTLDSETLLLMSEHSALLQRSSRTALQDQRLKSLQIELRSRMGTFGNTRAQRAAMAAAAVIEGERLAPHIDQLIHRRLQEALIRPEGNEGDSLA